MICAGSVRAKNAMNIMLTKVLPIGFVHPVVGQVQGQVSCSWAQEPLTLLGVRVVHMVGAIAGLNIFKLKMNYDDPLEAARLHGGCGTWGFLFTGLFAKEEFVIQACNSGSTGVVRPYCLILGGGFGLIGAQIVEIFVIFVWVSATIWPMFYALNKLKLLRISIDEEVLGLDISSHGGYAYAHDHAHQENNDPRSHADYMHIQDDQSKFDFMILG
ncbi:Ammonium transporter 1 member [Arachis hypogaea]|nr:Ammonium transporter 1 member [Arachis hypogaea]